MNKTIIGVIIAVILAVVAGGIYFASNQGPTRTVETTTPQTPTVQDQDIKEESAETTFKKENFDNIKTPHFVSSNPSNNEVLTTGPSQVSINFNFNLTSGSKISVMADGNEVTAAPTKISDDKLSMSVLVNSIKPANYKVNYTACWPDGSCHDGSFGFSVQSP